MVFSSTVFICIFLPVVFAAYYIIRPMRGKNILLALVSILFYAYGEPVYVVLMLASVVMNYIFGRVLGKRTRSRRKAWLAVSVICNLGILGFFKYADMFIGALNLLPGLNLPLMELALPIGISFFTFQAMSYVIDVYRGDVECQRDFINVLLYISFFPQLIAGPIVKYHDIEGQITNRKSSPEDVARGIRRFIVGLGKKVLIANTMAVAADAIFSAPSSDINILGAWIGAVSYVLQIYYDFSGYSDMAIGLGSMFGFHFHENFHFPYVSCSIQEFWRRWHISLSTWFKEYLYIPLGGNRKGRARTYINRVIVFLCTGLWHGANWTFVFWGIFHGAFMVLEDVLPIKKLPKALGHIYSLLVVTVGFVIFRADTLVQGFTMIGRMFGGFFSSSGAAALSLGQLTPMFIVMAAAGIIGSMPISERIRRKADGTAAVSVLRPLSYLASAGLLLICMFRLAGGAYNPFIYFRF